MNEQQAKTCQQCFGDYLPGEGVPEIGGESERFCCDQCAENYDRDYEQARHGDGEGQV